MSVNGISGPQFLADPEGNSRRLAEQLRREAAEAASAPPPRYQWGGHYWCAVKHGRWPNVTGWAEHRHSQRIFKPKLDELLAQGIPKKEAWRRAAAYAERQMLALTTRRKESSDRYYAQLDTVPEAEPPITTD